MRGDRIKCLGLRTYRTSCINATDSICRRARTESQSVVKLGQWARVDDKSNRSRSACGNATCGTFQHFRIAPVDRHEYVRLLQDNVRICHYLVMNLLAEKAREFSRTGVFTYSDALIWLGGTRNEDVRRFVYSADRPSLDLWTRDFFASLVDRLLA